jgi:3-oxoacyl-[acyl-carrier-protein] synthase-3
MPSAVITGLGHYLPEKVLSSLEVENRIRSNGYRLPEGIIQRLSGVVQRCYTPESAVSSELAALAGKHALEHANANPSSIDILIFASASQDISEPATANIVQENLECTSAHVFDVKNACLSFLNALDIAAAYIHTGRAKRILITTGEVVSPVINWQINDPDDLSEKFAALTLGDGGGACLVEVSADQERGILPGHFFSDGTHWRRSTVLSGGTLLRRDASRFYFECDSAKLHALALEHIPPLITRTLSEVSWNLQDIQLIVPHQASVPIIREICERLNYPLGRCAIIADQTGNMAAASIPVALSKAHNEGMVKQGDKILLVGGASGFSAGVIPIIL